MKPLPRGIRNRNPGNIETSQKFVWIGEMRPSQDSRFATFDEPRNGLRAMMKLLINYQRKHGINTLRKAIERWAPHTENQTNIYVDFVAKHADVRPDEVWDFKDPVFLVPVTKAMAVYENGFPPKDFQPNWYSNKVYWEAYELAVKGKIESHTMNQLKEKEPWKKLSHKSSQSREPSFLLLFLQRLGSLLARLKSSKSA